jgi:LacI family transcriptional regulator
MPQVPKVALMWESSSHFGREILRGCVRYSRLHGPWSLYLCGGDLEQELPKKVDFTGIIARGYSLKAINHIKATGLPAVVGEPEVLELALPGAYSRLPKIVTNGQAIAKMVVEYFCDRGLLRLAFCGFENCPCSLEREQAFCQQAKDCGHPCSTYRIDVRNWLRAGDWGRAWDNEQIQLANWVKSLPKLTGLMVCNDMCGRHVLEACRQAEVQVPEHVAVLGVDDDELVCESSYPPLSSVALDVETAGYKAAQLLDQLMSGTTPTGEQVISVEPIGIAARRSSRVVVKDDPLVAKTLCFIEGHAGRGIGVPDVVSEIGVSRRTLERRFSRAMGRSILAQVNQSRLDRAKCLLQETDLPVYRVATEVGFANARMLNRIFSRGEHILPTVFRRNSKQGLPPQGEPAGHRASARLAGQGFAEHRLDHRYGAVEGSAADKFDLSKMEKRARRKPEVLRGSSFAREFPRTPQPAPWA